MGCSPASEAPAAARLSADSPFTPASRQWADLSGPALTHLLTDRSIAVIPIGAIEHHGPHLPLRTDALVAEIELVESDAIGTIGVGESTVPPFLQLLAKLGVDEQVFVREVQASFKLGIQFRDWKTKGQSYFHPFGTIGAPVDLALRLAAPDARGLTVIVMHLGLARSSRRAQLARLIAKAVRISGQDFVMTGDFNEWHDDRGLESLAGLQVVAPGPSWPAPWPMLRYDRLALSAGLTLHASGVHDSPLARRASDHLPIWADIALSAP